MGETGESGWGWGEGRWMSQEAGAGREVRKDRKRLVNKSKQNPDEDDDPITNGTLDPNITSV